MTIVRRTMLTLATANFLCPASVMAQDAAPTFARIFTDHAVLQRDRPDAVWGHATAGVGVTVSVAGHSIDTTANRDGNWRVLIPAHAAGSSYRLSATSKDGTATLDDIAFGDVYLCGGQSNMEFPVRLSTGAWGGLGDAGNADLRFVTIEKDSAPAPRGDLKTPVAWKVVTPETVGDASAVCYYMARSLQKRLKIPIGFIAADWGGTTIQSWISPPALRGLATYRPGVDAVALFGSDPKRAQADEGRRVEEWWTAHDPDAKTQRAWILPDYDDAAWPIIVPNGSWRDAGIASLSSFDGAVWFRTTITLSAAQARAATELQLGPIDSYDTAWVNGVRVGGGTINWAWRNYPVLSGTLKAGPNVVVLRVLGGKTGGGLTGQPKVRGIKLASSDVVPLDPTWRYHLGSRVTAPPIGPSPWDVPTSLTTLYNGMIAPLTGYNIKLAAWYQGESNADAAAEYATLLPLLMADWRKQFRQPALPFLIVQLSSFGAAEPQPAESGWAALRDVQAKVAAADAHAAVVVTADVGDRTDVHPTQKTVVGERLARAARAVAYGEAISPGGPVATAVERHGVDLVVRFRDLNGGLRTYSSDVAIGFEACTLDRCRFVAGRANAATIVLAGANAPGVNRVRYAWGSSAYVNLYDADDLPVVPFELVVRP